MIEEKVKQKAKEMYMQFESLTKISETLDLKMTTLKNHTRTWNKEREARSLDFLNTFCDSKKALVYNICGNSLKVLDNIMADAAEGKVKLGHKAVAQVTGMLRMLNQLTHMDTDSVVIQETEESLDDPFSKDEE